MHKKTLKFNYVVCIRNLDCDDLEIRKLYAVLPDDKAKEKGLLRVIDESGEDYLYPEDNFIFIELPQKAKEAFTCQHVETVVS